MTAFTLLGPRGLDVQLCCEVDIVKSLSQLKYKKKLGFILGIMPDGLETRVLYVRRRKRLRKGLDF